MGDRAVFGLLQPKGETIYIYGHWAGHNMFAQFANALSRATAAGRLPDDEFYANRIIISSLVGEEWNQDLGWGVGVNTVPDTNHKIPVYDYKSDHVTLWDYDWNREDGLFLTDMVFTIPRPDFIRKYAKSEVMV